eukprot:scaffold316287_cov32-Tisochrysis_lutea.AAC.2
MSARGMYGGLETMRSKRLGRPSAAAEAAFGSSTASYRPSSVSRRALANASATAASLTSSPTQVAERSWWRRASPMAPEPQPISSKRSSSPAADSAGARSRTACSTSSTSSSVSGRGISTGGASVSVRS